MRFVRRPLKNYVEVERDLSTWRHGSYCPMASPIKFIPHMAYMSITRFLHNHFYGGALRRNISPYASIFTHSHRNHNAHIRNPWFASLATDSTQVLASLFSSFFSSLRPSFPYTVVLVSSFKTFRSAPTAPGEMLCLAVILILFMVLKDM